MLSPKTFYATPPLETEPTEFDSKGMQLAYEQGKLGLSEGGVPIGACLLSASGKVLGVGRNRRVQSGSAIRHGETDCLELIGRMPASVYSGATMFTTLSPCSMCSGALILYGIKRCVMGENETFVGGEGILIDHGVSVINLNLDNCKELMRSFIEAKPEVWNEDIGV